MAPWRRSGGEALERSRAGLGRLDLAVLRRGGRHQGGEQLPRRRGDGLDRTVERLLIGLRGLRRAADLADVLQGRRLDFLVGGGGREVVGRGGGAAPGASVTAGPGGSASVTFSGARPRANGRRVSHSR